MLIDWFTVGAQILNFLILVWLLKRFLYHPILNAIDAREQRIAKELADADAEKTEAGQEREAYQRKNAAFDKERAALLSQATDAANSERQRLLDAARQEAINLGARQQDSLRSEAQALHQEIFRRTQQEVFSIARKALSDLAGATLEERMVSTFIARLRSLGAADQQRLAGALQNKALPIVVRSTFELSAAHRASLEAELQALLGRVTTVSFETAAELVSGIELCTDGQQVAWSIAHYLTELESTVGDLLTVNTATNAVSGKEDSHA
ncbi:F0F1 ATP synthase subunit delta [Pseudomonas sp. MWU13-2100]|uniref:F0F1 ATP synthase subunit delta n=1 Tax=Pseudomonas sp. MWU13-2100 TaxID=2935075 RepID=UPI00201013F0|nr:F0F1 ATP synthase subunit delta [Pseudomonas sp. MWU13-2100]